MKSQTKFSPRFLSKYDLIVISLIGGGILLAVILWFWFGYKQTLIDNEILKLK